MFYSKRMPGVDTREVATPTPAELRQEFPELAGLGESKDKSMKARHQEVARGLTPEGLKREGKRLFKELGKITDTDENRSIHRRMQKVWTSLTRSKTHSEDQEHLWTQTKDVTHPTMEVRSEEVDGESSITEGPPRDGDMVIEGYGDQSKNQVDSYIVQLNTVKGERNRHHKIKITPSGISLLTRIADTENFEPDPNFTPLLLNELQETIQQVVEKSKSK